MTTPLSSSIRLQLQIGEPQGFILSQTPMGSVTAGVAGLEDLRLDVNAVLDEDQLDGSKYYWLNVLGETSHISIQRGMAIGQGGQPFPLAGTLYATVDSPTIDPFNSIQFRPNVKCRFQVFYDGDWRNVFRGRLREIGSQYSVDGQVLVTFEATDAIDDLNQGVLDLFEVPAENTGQRIRRILTEAKIDKDKVPATSFHDFEMTDEELTQNALEASIDALTHEMGSLFVTKDNQIQFLNYGATNSPYVEDPIFTNGEITEDNEITLTGVQMSSGKELFFNKVIGQTANDPNIYVKQGTISIKRYGLNTFEYRAMKFKLDLDLDEQDIPIPEAGAGQTEVFSWLDKFLARWADTPQEITYTGTRRYPKSVSVINRPDSYNYPVMAEIGDQVTVKFLTDYVDIEQESMIIAISHDIDPRRWVSTIDLVPIPNT